MSPTPESRDSEAQAISVGLSALPVATKRLTHVLAFRGLSSKPTVCGTVSGSGLTNSLGLEVAGGG